MLSALMRGTTGTGVGVGRGEGDKVLVKGDGLMQPLPGLVQGVNSITNPQTVTTVTWHSSSGMQNEGKKSQACENKGQCERTESCNTWLSTRTTKYRQLLTDQLLLDDRANKLTGTAAVAPLYLR